MNSRRRFLIQTPLALLAASACRVVEQKGQAAAGDSTTAGAPPTFGTAPGVGPAVTPATFAEAEKLAQVTMTPGQRQQAADSWRQTMAPYLERRTGPRKLAIDYTDAPGTVWNPALPGVPVAAPRDRFVRGTDSAPLPVQR